MKIEKLKNLKEAFIVIRIRNLKEGLNQGLILKKVNWVIKLNKKSVYSGLSILEVNN